MRPSTSLRLRVDPTLGIAVLAVGDLLALLAFVVLGATHHGGNALLLPGRVVGSVLPFWLGWLFAAFVGGLYTVDALSSLLRALGWAAPAWIVAVAIGQAFRSTALFPGNASLVFALVTLAFGGLLLLGWRGIAALVATRLF